MDTKHRKQQLIDWIDGLHDDRLLGRIELLKSMSNDWDDSLSNAEKKMIEAGPLAIENNDVIDHQKVMEEAAAYRW